MYLAALEIVGWGPLPFLRFSVNIGKNSIVVYYKQEEYFPGVANSPFPPCM